MINLSKPKTCKNENKLNYYYKPLFNNNSWISCWTFVYYATFLFVCYLFSTSLLNRFPKTTFGFIINITLSSFNNKTRRNTILLNIVTSSDNNSIETPKFDYIVFREKKHYNHSLNKIFLDMNQLGKVKDIAYRNSREAFDYKCSYTSTNKFIVT